MQLPVRSHISRRRRRGQGLVEWGLGISLIAIIAAAALSTMGQRVSGMLSGIVSSTDAAAGRSDTGEVLSSTDDGGGVGATSRKQS
ncbi:MAG: hypothetical protein HYY25_08280 [Candidatus Wallbacteria bacterium]|nr:hypothetical protein [Candidatus Wallbacteria bacterium]